MYLIGHDEAPLKAHNFQPHLITSFSATGCPDRLPMDSCPKTLAGDSNSHPAEHPDGDTLLCSGVNTLCSLQSLFLEFSHLSKC